MRKRKSAVEKARFRTINDLMDDIEQEISTIKDGSLSEAKARVVAKNRHMQIEACNLILSAARLEARFRPALSSKFGLPAPEPKNITTLPQ